MNKARALTVALVLQLAGLLSLTQTWFRVSMQADGSNVELGSFDGSTTYPVLSQLSLLCIAALAVAAISAAKPRSAAILIAAAGSLSSLLLAVPLIVSRDISALDSQLDRLTGIANTHGLQDVEIVSTGLSLVWILASAMSLVFACWMLVLSKSWSNQDRAAKTERKSSADLRAKGLQKTSIELWDDQRQ